MIFSAANAHSQSWKIAILLNGEKGAAVTENLAENFNRLAKFKVLDSEMSVTAAHGAGYQNSLNLTLENAKNLGLSLGCDFYLLGDVNTWRRSSSAKPVYFEIVARIMLVSARTGRLISWRRVSFTDETPEKAEKQFQANLPKLTNHLSVEITVADEREKNERAILPTNDSVIEELPDETADSSKNFRIPLPYRRLRPNYTEAARLAAIEATVDVLVDLNEKGDVVRTEITRWAGFDLDDEVINTVRKMSFRPALRDENPLPVRVLLRYNFRRPRETEEDEK
jgi:TonB family protein